jgi:hypothetical protein
VSSLGEARAVPQACVLLRDLGQNNEEISGSLQGPASTFEQMKQATPEQQRSGTEAWVTWFEQAGPSIVDGGAPLGKSLRVTTSGAAAVANDLGGYSILQAESKEALAPSLTGHPHFLMREGVIELVEIMAVPTR